MNRQRDESPRASARRFASATMLVRDIDPGDVGAARRHRQAPAADAAADVEHVVAKVHAQERRERAPLRRLDVGVVEARHAVGADRGQPVLDAREAARALLPVVARPVGRPHPVARACVDETSSTRMDVCVVGKVIPVEAPARDAQREPVEESDCRGDEVRQRVEEVESRREQMLPAFLVGRAVGGVAQLLARERACAGSAAPRPRSETRCRARSARAAPRPARRAARAAGTRPPRARPDRSAPSGTASPDRTWPPSRRPRAARTAARASRDARARGRSAASCPWWTRRSGRIASPGAARAARLRARRRSSSGRRPRRRGRRAAAHRTVATRPAAERGRCTCRPSDRMGRSAAQSGARQRGRGCRRCSRGPSVSLGFNLCNGRAVRETGSSRSPKWISGFRDLNPRQPLSVRGARG